MNDVGFGARMVGMAKLSFKLLQHTIGIDDYADAEKYFDKKFDALCCEMSDWMESQDKEQSK